VHTYLRRAALIPYQTITIQAPRLVPILITWSFPLELLILANCFIFTTLPFTVITQLIFALESLTKRSFPLSEKSNSKLKRATRILDPTRQLTVQPPLFVPVPVTYYLKLDALGARVAAPPIGFLSRE
jgi:hypothetical protein